MAEQKMAVIFVNVLVFIMSVAALRRLSGLV
jgi:hypothetical protein